VFFSPPVSKTISLLMDIARLRLHCYLAEWYRSGTTDDADDRTAAALESARASMNFEGSSVALISLLAIPTDEVLLGRPRRRDVRSGRYPPTSAHRCGRCPRR
jgi:hypothetical protein